jgi:hypothetical protein
VAAHPNGDGGEPPGPTSRLTSVDFTQAIEPSASTWLSTPNCGLNIRPQITPAITGAIISGRISTRSKIRPTRLERLSSRAIPMPVVGSRYP